MIQFLRIIFIYLLAKKFNRRIHNLLLLFDYSSIQWTWFNGLASPVKSGFLQNLMILSHLIELIP